MNELRRLWVHAWSKRGLLVTSASLLAIASLFLEGWAATVLAAAAIAVYAVLLLTMSVRISQLVSELRQAQRGFGGVPAIHATVDGQKDLEEDRRSAQRVSTAIGTLTNASALLSARSHTAAPLSMDDLSNPRLVSVVVPCFNEQRYVAEALRSILAQTYSNWECLVVDDASTDDSLAEIWSITKTDPRFRVLRHRVNSGLSAARNSGLRAARGDYVTFLDADDVLMRGSLIDRVAALANTDNDPHILGSYCGVHVAFQDISLDDLPSQMTFPESRVIDFVAADSECPFNAHAPLLVTDRLRQLGGFDERMRFGAEDWDLWYRAMRNGYVFVPSTYRTAVYRQKRDSMVRSMPDGHVAEANRLIEAAYGTADPTILNSATPTPLTKPIGAYQSLLHRADRSVRFAAMALVAGDEDAARRALDVFKDAPLSLIERHINLSDLSAGGMRRALAISYSELNAVTPLIDPIAKRLEQLIRETSMGYEPEPVELHTAPSVRALLVPYHAVRSSQCCGPLTVKASRPKKSEFSLSKERVATRASRLHIPPSIPTWSLNEWVLHGGRCSAVVVGGVRTGVVDQIAEAVAAGAGRVVEVDTDQKPVDDPA